VQMKVWIHCNDIGPASGPLTAIDAAISEELGRTIDYDMGDGWIHRIVIEAVPEFWFDADLRVPICTAGENTCPPEDVGGPHGYQHFRECIANRAHPEHSEWIRWIGGVFDPKGFDLNRLNRDWRPGRRGR